MGEYKFYEVRTTPEAEATRAILGLSSFRSGDMARTAFGRSVCLMRYYRISLNFNPTVPRTKLAQLLSPAAPLFIISACFSSNLQIPDSGNLNLDGKHESHSALTDFLRSYEFSEAEIHIIIKRRPQILSSRVSTNLKPKLDYLVECGFHGSALRRVITSDPQILSMSLHNHIKPRYQFLEAYLKEKVNSVIVRRSQILRQPSVELCVEYLKEEGVPAERITKLFADTSNYLGHGKSRLTKLVEATKALGIKPADNMFIWYIKMFGSMSKTSWKKKLEVFKSLGWSDQDIRATHLIICSFVFKLRKRS